jgi:hypothetical protein
MEAFLTHKDSDGYPRIILREPRENDIRYIEVPYKHLKLFILVKVLNVRGEQCEVTPIGGDGSCFYVQNTELYEHVKL